MPVSKHTLSAFFSVAISVVMMALFVSQASVAFHRHALPTFSSKLMVAFGYPPGDPGCQGGVNNSVMVAGEDCDNGGGSGDGCSDQCVVETGYSCVGSAPSVCTTTCGDGIKAGSEACDDSNTSNGDGCSSSCTIESGYYCNGSAPSICSTTCGDGIVSGGEQCDDSGESVSCNADCTNASCGDGRTNLTAGEACDNGGNNGNTKACSASCQKTYCGDNIIQTPNGNGQTESCEPALNSTCSNSCTVALGIGASNDPAPLTTVPTSVRLAPPVSCGNGVVEADKNEQCDDGRFNGISGSCDRWCQALYCGDNIVQQQNGEECEPLHSPNGGYVIPACGRVCTVPLCTLTSGCSGGCHWMFLSQCTASSSSAQFAASSQASSQGAQLSQGSQMSQAQASQPFVPSMSSAMSFTDIQTEIGNGIVETTGPLDGPQSSAMYMSPVFIPPTFPTSSLPSLPGSSAPSAQCGDGVLQAPEECDNGPYNSDTVPNACRLNCTKALCGDSVLDAGEECDRGAVNNQLANGCTPTCKISLCGNYALEPGEECDDGPRNSASKPDSCSTLCLLPHCSDGVIDPAFGEICDNGLNNSNTQPDACRLNCLPARCGDGVKDGGELCDDGHDGSATCSPQCKPITSLPVTSASPESSSIMSYLILVLLILTAAAGYVAHRMNKTFR